MVGCTSNLKTDCDKVRDMASTGHYYEQSPASRMDTMVHTEMDGFLDVEEVRGAGLTQVLPAGLRYVEGSANLAPQSVTVSGDTTTVIWSWAADSAEPVAGRTITYKVKPVELGEWTITGEAGVTDSKNRKNSSIIDAVTVRIEDAPCVPTPPPAPPTQPIVPPTPPPLPTSAPHQTIPGRIYLPLLVTESCQDQRMYADVALVIDDSSSMAQLTRDGRSKLAAAQAAARSFVGLMDFTPDRSDQHDQVAVVAFNSTAWIQQALTNDPALLLHAIDALPGGQAEQTRLDLAFERGTAVLRSDQRKRGNAAVLIVMTDGKPSHVPVADDGTMGTTVLHAATTAKSFGIRVYTVGVGNTGDVDLELLSECATVPSMTYLSPDAEDLGKIYAQIANAMGCPKERLWGKR